MKIILQEDVPNLGKAGEIKEVAPGYARNYLIPRKCVLPATETNIRLWEEKKKLIEKKELEKIKQAQELAKVIEKMSSTIEVKVGQEEKLFGAVTNNDIAEALNKEGIKIDKKDILLTEDIHNIGVYTVDVRLHPGVTAKLKVWVVAQRG